MTAPLRAFWWSPRNDLRTLAHELRDHAPAWLRLTTAPGRAFTNHGDELSQLVLTEVFERPVRWAPLGKEDVVAIGSAIAPYIARGGVGRIWGTGVHTPDIAAADAARIRDRVLAIRGPLAREALALDPGTPLGDPGLIVRTLRAPRPIAARRGTVLITHFTSHMTRDGLDAIASLRAEGVRVLPPTLRPRDMLAAIGDAEHVLSAGMHGVILAHALRTPATLVSLAPAPASVAPSFVAPTPSFKYHDYHRSVGLEARLTPWRDLLTPVGRRRARELGAADVDRADVVIDSLVDGLLRAAAPLRTH